MGALWDEWSVRQQNRLILELNRSEKARKANSVNQSGQQSQWTPEDNPRSDCDSEYLSRILHRNLVPLSLCQTIFNRVTGRSGNISTGRKSGFQRQNTNVRPKGFLGFWKPSISLEEDAVFCRGNPAGIL